MLAHLEHGRRQARQEHAEACDRALGTAPLLASLLRTGPDSVRRRELLGHIARVASGVALPDIVRHQLMGATENTDWDQLSDYYARRLVTDPSAQFGATLLSELMNLEHLISEVGGTPDTYRAVSALSQTYGLWLGNVGQLPRAHGFYRAAAVYADKSGDMDLRCYTRGRALARGVYEGFTLQQTTEGASQVLSLTGRATTGALEAHAALVHVHALTKDAKAGRAAVDDMRRVVDQLPPEALQGMTGPEARTAFLGAFLEARAGTLRDAERACEDALPLLSAWPLWKAETRVYLGRAMIAGGDVRGGIAYALRTMDAMGHDVRVVSVAVRDAVTSVPHGYRSDELTALRAYASREPGPWEALE